MLPQKLNALQDGRVSAVHTSGLTAPMIIFFDGEIISCFDSVHLCTATLVDSTVGLMSAYMQDDDAGANC